MIAYVDCSSGVSGDKLLAALIEAGADVSALEAALASLGFGPIDVAVERVARAGVTGGHVTISSAEDQPRRSWTEIRAAIEAAPLSDAVRSSALAVFTALAEAEAAVHGTAVDDVHFHEVGAIDSIADVVGVCWALHALDVTRLVASPIATGAGTVRTAHGVLPVPAPATALLLRGAPVQSGPAEGELTTPTGAALVTTLADAYGDLPPMTVVAVGHGAGTRQLSVPNVARVFLGTQPGPSRSGLERVTLLETTIDHLSGEQLANAADRLRAAGALDVWFAPVTMKKGRPGVVLSALARSAEAAALATRVIAETGSLGVRVLPAERVVAEREVIELATSLGTVRFKVAEIDGPGPAVRPESDDVACIARELGHAESDVRRALEIEAAALLGNENPPR
ncbi:MAG: nickel pincer cofactor biosynthesis protein LarC [Coriobacteriia bacterium]